MIRILTAIVLFFHQSGSRRRRRRFGARRNLGTLACVQSLPSVHPYRDADERAVRASLEPDRLRAPAVASLKTKNGDPRVIPLNSVALAALRSSRVRGNLDNETVPVFPSVRTGDSLQGSRGWFSTALDEAKVLDYTWHCNRHTFASRLLWPGLICARLQSCSGTGHFRWSCGTPISHRNTRLRRSIAWSIFGNRTDTRTDTGVFGVKRCKYTKTRK